VASACRGPTRTHQPVQDDAEVVAEREGLGVVLSAHDPVQRRDAISCLAGSVRGRRAAPWRGVCRRLHARCPAVHRRPILGMELLTVHVLPLAGLVTSTGRRIILMTSEYRSAERTPGSVA